MTPADRAHLARLCECMTTEHLTDYRRALELDRRDARTDTTREFCAERIAAIDAERRRRQEPRS